MGSWTPELGQRVEKEKDWVEERGGEWSTGAGAKRRGKKPIWLCMKYWHNDNGITHTNQIHKLMHHSPGLLEHGCDSERFLRLSSKTS
jgi:hypothetical protein